MDCPGGETGIPISKSHTHDAEHKTRCGQSQNSRPTKVGRRVCVYQELDHADLILSMNV